MRLFKKFLNKLAKPQHLDRTEDDFKWRDVPVFISSTFNDMHAERDLLVKQVFPDLREWCAKRRLTLVDIDLRWGVTEEEATDNNNAVGVCLKNIDESRPFFLCFLGQRYGWQPGEADYENAIKEYPNLKSSIQDMYSVTEHEIHHALFSKYHLPGKLKQYLPVEAPLFLRRSDGYLGQMHPEAPAVLKRIYSDLHDENQELKAELQRKKKNLEQVILSAHTITDYSVEWDNTQTTPELAIPLRCPSEKPDAIKQWQALWKKYAGINLDQNFIPDNSLEMEAALKFNEQLCRGRLGKFQSNGDKLAQVISDLLKDAILKRFPRRKSVESMIGMKPELEQQESFLLHASKGYVKRKDDFVSLDDYFESQSNGFLAVSAQAGGGKTTLLANWIFSLRQPGNNSSKTKVIFRFIGASDRSTTVEELLLSIFEEIHDDGLLSRPIPQDIRELRLNWIDLIGEVAQTKPLLLVIDGLDQLESGMDDLSWLPGKLPESFKLIFSFKLGSIQSDSFLAECRKSSTIDLCDVPFFDDSHKRMMINLYLERYLKRLDPNHIETLLSLKGAQQPGSPLFIKIILSELRMFGAFSQLREEIEKSFGHTPVSAFNRLLIRLEKDPAYTLLPPKTTVPVIMGTLAHARHGLSVFELSDIVYHYHRQQFSIESVEDAVNLVLRQVRSFLAIRSGRYGFFYDSFKQACIEKYTQTETIETWNRLLADYFERTGRVEGAGKRETGKRFNRRMLSELPYHLTEANELNRLADFLCDINFIQAKYQANMPDELLSDYERLKISENSTDETSAGLYQFKTFNRVNNKLLRNDPGLLMQLALKEPAANAVFVQADQLVYADTQKKSYFMWQNKPEHISPVSLSYPMLSDRIIDVSLGKDRHHFVSVDTTGRLVILAVESGKILLNKKVSDTPISSPVLSETQNRVGFIEGMSNFIVYRISPFQEIHSHQMHCLIDFCVANEAANHFAFVCDKNVYFYDLEKDPILFAGHSDSITDCCISPDSKLMATVSKDKSIRVWDVDGQTLLWFSRKHFEQVSCCCFSSTGKYLVTGSIDEVILWNATIPAMVQRQVCRHGVIRDIDIIFEDELSIHVLTCGDDGTVRTSILPLARDIEPGHSQAYVWQAKSGPLKWCKSVSDRSAIIVQDNSQAIEIRFDKFDQDARDLNRWGRYPVYSGYMSDNTYAWGNSDGRVMLVGNGTDQFVKLHNDGVNCIKNIPFTEEFITAGGDGKLCFCSSEGYETLLPTTHGNTGIRAISTLDHGRLIFSGAEDGTLRSWQYDGDSLIPIAEIKTRKNSSVIGSVPNETDSGVYIVSKKYIEFWDMEKGSPRTIWQNNLGTPVAIMSDTNWLVIVTKDGDVIHWPKDAIETNSPDIKNLNMNSEVVCANLVNGGLITAHKNNRVMFWDFSSLDQRAVFPVDCGIKNVVSPGRNNQVLVCGENGEHFILTIHQG